MNRWLRPRKTIACNHPPMSQLQRCPLCSRGINSTMLKTGTVFEQEYPNSKVQGANMGPIWGRQGPDVPHVGSMKFAIWAVFLNKSGHRGLSLRCIYNCDLGHALQRLQLSGGSNDIKGKISLFTMFTCTITPSKPGKKYCSGGVNVRVGLTYFMSSV